MQGLRQRPIARAGSARDDGRVSRLHAIVWILWGLCLASGARAAAADWSQPHFESVPGTEELGNGIITALAQDASGLVWIGTTEGLLRYDGYRLRRFQRQRGRSDGLSDNYVRALLPLPDGRLWVATQSGGIAVYTPQGESFSQHRHDPARAESMAEDGAVALALDRDGAIWVGYGNRGVDRFDPGSGRFEHFPALGEPARGPLHGTVRSLLVDRDGDLWIGSGGGLQRRRAGADRFETVLPDAPPDGFAGQYVYALYQANDGAIWVGTQGDGAARLQADGAGGWDLLRLPVDEGGLGHAWVDGFVEPVEGQLWIATFGGGIDVFSSDGRRRLQRIRSDPAVAGSLALDRLVAPLRDRSGLVWVGTWGAGAQWHNPLNSDAVQRLRHYRQRDDGLSEAHVLSLLALEDGRLWIGTSGNGIDVFDAARGVVGGYRPDPQRAGALRDGTVRAMASTADGRRWVGTQQAGLFRFDPALDGFVAEPARLPDRRIRLLRARADGSLAVGTQRGLALLDAEGAASTVRLTDGQRFDEPVWSLHEDAAGQLWVGYPGGLLRLGGSGLEPGSAGNGDGPAGVLDLRADRHGGIWALALDGLFHLADPSAPPAWRSVPLDLGEADTGLGRQFLIDDKDRLWTPRYLIDPRNASARRLEASDGFDIGNVDMGGALRLAGGQLLFAGTRGLLQVQPDRYRPWTFDPPLTITGLQIDGLAQHLGQPGRLVLPPGARRFSVEFAALDYSAPQRNRYAHRLVGLDRDWIPLGAESRQASYSRPWPGRYRLQLRGSNRDGVWASAPLEIDVEVRPHLWQTPLFGLAMLLLTALAIGLAWRWRTRSALQRAARLQTLVDERTAALREARDQAEQSLDALRRTQDQLVAAEKLAALGQLVAGVAHEINTPVGVALTAASHLRERAVENAAALDSGRITRRQLAQLQADLQEGCELILASLQRTGQLVASFKRVAVDRSEEPASRFRADELASEIEATLQPACQRGGHRLQLDCLGEAELEGFPGTLFQIVASLAGNALAHAFEEGGGGTLRVRIDASGDPVELLVEDDGRGMPAEVAARAFDPFFTTRRGSGASGLGLHIVHSLVTRVLGGSIELDSTPGRGSRFRIRFPRRLERAESGKTEGD